MPRKPTRRPSARPPRVAKRIESLGVPKTPKAPKPPKPEPQGPSSGSLARRKRELIDELRSGGTAPGRASEIRAVLAAELAEVPILSHHELERLGD